MPELLIGLLSVSAIVLVSLVLPVGIIRWHLGRRNRVHPKIASPAPLRWLVAPSAPARLHRRLQTTVRVASTHTGRAVPVEIAEHAVELDRRVVLAAHQPYGGRTAVIRELRAEADELDRLALAVTRPLEPNRVGAARERLTLLAEARAEVDAMDHTIR